MENTTSIKVPKKYHKMIRFLETELQDDGETTYYWLYTEKGYAIEYEGIHVMSEETRSAIIADIRDIIPCTCDECIE